jgi:hypothetical protein
MAPILAASWTFACAFGGAVAGTIIRSKLPEPHLSKESQDVVRLGMGLVATMTALLLGLVTASARSTFDSHDAAVKNSAANILSLDRLLARYGPETAATRTLLKRAVAYRMEMTWPSDGSNGKPFTESRDTPPVEEIQNGILRLTPQNDAQRWLQNRALTISEEIVKTRWIMLGSTGSAVPTVFLDVVIFWLTVTFVSFGLYAPRNMTVIAVLFVAALSVAAAVFLVLELDGPFDGLIKIRSEPMRYTLENLGK